ncbi:hypothetical protein [Nostoc sp. UHCC 0252]|uniref:hypothetical protein n=1 Tax=Nostoc sp. UHCC 0252 TaxID=3110241 RepID=UPI002B21C054|nr:hypothetical protein [Nostoc sp. UHCC 0252]MEA5605928.1 hypothetical protein [Nostoc sp. UHCC 0252]
MSKNVIVKIIDAPGWMNNFLILNSLMLLSQIPNPDPKFLQLKNQLENLGFHVMIELPPKRGAYGLLRETDKKIWINPVVFDLNIGNQVLIHESVHAAQVCAGKGKIKVLGLDIQPSNYTRPFFLRYRNVHRQELEREAYAVQSHPLSFELAISLLQKHCK